MCKVSDTILPAMNFCHCFGESVRQALRLMMAPKARSTLSLMSMQRNILLIGRSEDCGVTRERKFSQSTSWVIDVEVAEVNVERVRCVWRYYMIWLRLPVTKEPNIWTEACGQMLRMTSRTRCVAASRMAASSAVGSRNRQNSTISA